MTGDDRPMTEDELLAAEETACEPGCGPRKTLEELGRACGEVRRLRVANVRLHRRAQQAEGLIARAGLIDGRPQGPAGRSLGRALANYAAAHHEREAGRWRRIAERMAADLASLAWEIAGVEITDAEQLRRYAEEVPE